MNDSKKILDLSVKAGELLLQSGAEIFRVQETMIKIANHYGAQGFNVYVVSNGIFASVNSNGTVHSTEIRHVPFHPVHLGRVAAVNQLSREIAEGKFTPEQAFARLEEIKVLPYAANWFQILASGVGSACFCFIFGGNFYDSMTALISGLLLYCFVLFAGRHNFTKIITHILGSGLVTLCGLLFFHLGLGEHMDKIIIGSIIPLVPGVALTTSIRDFFNGDYLSGTIRLIDAVLIAFCIAVGVGVVLKFAQLFGGIAI